MKPSSSRSVSPVGPTREPCSRAPRATRRRRTASGPWRPEPSASPPSPADAPALMALVGTPGVAREAAIALGVLAKARRHSAGGDGRAHGAGQRLSEGLGRAHRPRRARALRLRARGPRRSRPLGPTNAGARPREVERRRRPHLPAARGLAKSATDDLAAEDAPRALFKKAPGRVAADVARALAKHSRDSLARIALRRLLEHESFHVRREAALLLGEAPDASLAAESAQAESRVCSPCSRTRGRPSAGTP